MTSVLQCIHIAPPVTRGPRHITNRSAQDGLVVRPNAPLRLGGYYVRVGNERLTSDTTFDLLGSLQRTGFRERVISIDAPHQHTTWASVDQAHAWCVADRQGYVMQWPRTMVLPDLWHASRIIEIATTLQIIKALGGAVVTYWPRPGNTSKYFGSTDFNVRHRVCFANAGDALLAVIVLGPTFDHNEYHKALRQLTRSWSPIGPHFDGLNSVVESAIERFRGHMTDVNLHALRTAFARAYPQNIQSMADKIASNRRPDRMGFP